MWLLWPTTEYWSRTRQTRRRTGYGSPPTQPGLGPQTPTQMTCWRRRRQSVFLKALVTRTSGMGSSEPRCDYFRDNGLQFFQILSLNPYFIGPGEFHFSGWAITAGAGNDIFSTTNRLQDGQSDDPQAYLAASVAGYSFIGVGVRDETRNGSALQSNGGAGVYGDSDTATGVYGSSNSCNGVWGQSNANQPAIRGYNNGPAGAAAPGVYGESAHWQGVYGISHSPGAGVHGANDFAGQGVWAESKNGDGLHAVSHSATAAGVSASNDGGGLAAAFQGNVTCFNDFSALAARTAFFTTLPCGELPRPWWTLLSAQTAQKILMSVQPLRSRLAL